MPVSWPSTLPKPIVDGYVFQPGDGRQITEMEQGPRRIRSRYINVPHAVTLPFMMTLAHLAIFKAFWEVDINYGVDPFDIELMIDGQRTIATVHIIARGQQIPIGGDLSRMSLQVETV